jgi:quercetin dioxygenase-like cupin family protein
MRRLIISGLLASCCAVALAAQSAPVSIDKEPHHKRLLYTNDVRLWEVTLPPGESTPAFVHDHDVATVVVGEGTLNIERNGQVLTPPAPNARGSVIVAEHTGNPAPYRIENNGTTDYRAFEVENMHDVKQTPPFAINDLALKTGDGPMMHQHTGAVIIVLISGTVEQGGIGGEEPVRISRIGQWLVIPRFQGHTLAAVGGDARAVEIEVK